MSMLQKRLRNIGAIEESESDDDDVGASAYEEDHQIGTVSPLAKSAIGHSSDVKRIKLDQKSNYVVATSGKPPIIKRDAMRSSKISYQDTGDVETPPKSRSITIDNIFILKDPLILPNFELSMHTHHFRAAAHPPRTKATEFLPEAKEDPISELPESSRSLRRPRGVNFPLLRPLGIVLLCPHKNHTTSIDLSSKLLWSVILAPHKSADVIGQNKAATAVKAWLKNFWQNSDSIRMDSTVKKLITTSNTKASNAKASKAKASKAKASKAKASKAKTSKAKTSKRILILVGSPGIGKFETVRLAGLEMGATVHTPVCDSESNEEVQAIVDMLNTKQPVDSRSIIVIKNLDLVSSIAPGRAGSVWSALGSLNPEGNPLVITVASITQKLTWIKALSDQIPIWPPTMDASHCKALVKKVLPLVSMAYKPPGTINLENCVTNLIRRHVGIIPDLRQMLTQFQFECANLNRPRCGINDSSSHSQVEDRIFRNIFQVADRIFQNSALSSKTCSDIIDFDKEMIAPLISTNLLCTSSSKMGPWTDEDDHMSRLASTADSLSLYDASFYGFGYQSEFLAHDLVMRTNRNLSVPSPPKFQKRSVHYSIPTALFKLEPSIGRRRALTEMQVTPRAMPWKNFTLEVLHYSKNLTNHMYSSGMLNKEVFLNNMADLQLET